MSRPSLTRVDICANLFELLEKLYERRSTRATTVGRHVPRVSDALRALCSGSITVDDYLSAKLDLAVEPLQSLLHPEQIATVRFAVLERIYTEPLWLRVVEELRAAAARRPPGAGDDGR